MLEPVGDVKRGCGRVMVGKGVAVYVHVLIVGEVDQAEIAFDIRHTSVCVCEGSLGGGRLKSLL